MRGASRRGLPAGAGSVCGGCGTLHTPLYRVSLPHQSGLGWVWPDGWVVRVRVREKLEELDDVLDGYARGWFTSRGTDLALMTAREVDSGEVSPFRVQSVSTRIRLPDMAERW